MVTNTVAISFIAEISINPIFKPMKPIKFLAFLLIAAVFPFTLLAQTPGGIATASTLWLKANYTTSPAKMTFSSSNVISGWRDEKSSFSLTQASVPKQPMWYDGSSTGLSSDSLNYNSNVKFNYSAVVADASLLANAAITPNLLGTAGTIIMVLNDDNAFRTSLTYYSDNVYRYQVKQTFRVQTSDGVAIQSPIATSPSYRIDYAASAYNSPVRNARIVVSRGFGSTLAVRRNSTNISLLPANSNVPLYCPGIIAGINLGGNPGVLSNEPFDGRFGEVITYNTSLSDADIQKIESYLAVKYGITLNPAGLDATDGYVSSAGTTIYSRGLTFNVYWNNIIGLGRDANSGLLQKQSHTYDDSVRLYAGATLATTNAGNSTAITDNGDFLMMGATTGKLMQDAATAAEKPNAATIRLDREWKLINTGFNQVFRLQIKLAASVSSYFTGGGILRLLADDDGNFINATEITDGVSGVTITHASGIITISITPASSGGIFPINGTPKYITIAAYNAILDANIINLLCTKIEKGVLVKWQTSAERSVDHFEIEKSTNLQNWVSIYSENGKGINGSGASYQFVDASALETTTYYRVKEINTLGKIAYTEIQKIIPSKKVMLLNIFPNPASEFVNITWNGFKRPQQIKVVSVDGRSYEVTAIINDYNAILKIEALPKGMYIIAVNKGTEIMYSKFCKN